MKRSWLIAIRGSRPQQYVAKKCKISQNHYSCIETGERSPSVDSAKRIAETLGFCWTKFFDDIQSRTEDKVLKKGGFSYETNDGQRSS